MEETKSVWLVCDCCCKTEEYKDNPRSAVFQLCGLPKVFSERELAMNYILGEVRRMHNAILLADNRFNSLTAEEQEKCWKEKISQIKFNTDYSGTVPYCEVKDRTFYFYYGMYPITNSIEEAGSND